MNDLNSVLLEGKGRHLDRGRLITVTSSRFRHDESGLVVAEVLVPVVALTDKAREQMLSMVDGQRVRLSGRMVWETDPDYVGVAVGAEHIELRKINPLGDEED